VKIKVQELTEDAFAPFGMVLGRPGSKQPNISDEIANVWLGFSDLMGIGSVQGRQITYLDIHSKPEKNNAIEKHNTSAEAFIPLDGRTVLMAVPAEATNADGTPDMSKCKAFLMDGSKGVLLKKSTWHAVPYLLSDSASYLVLVDDAIIEKDDINKVSIDEIEFYFLTKDGV